MNEVSDKVLWQAIDLVFNVSEMWHDVQTLTDGNASWWIKAGAAADLGVTIFTDINMLDGEGEAARAAEIGAEIAEKGVADVTETAGRDAVSIAEDAGKNANGPTSLYHYTTEEGMQGIVDSEALNPKDARYGDGQYLTDITPGSITKSQTTRRIFGIPWGTSRVSHFVEINVEGLTVLNPKSNIFLVPNDNALDLAGRIVSFGSTP